MRFIKNIILLIILATCSPAFAKDLPANITGKIFFSQVGTGEYKKFGFGIYQATLWAPDGKYDKSKPFALQLHYLRSISKDDVVKAVADDVEKQKLADSSTISKWKETLKQKLSAVKNGDEIVALSTPSNPTKLFFNGKKIASITDSRFSDSFFNIWLGDIADPGLRDKLLSQ